MSVHLLSADCSVPQLAAVTGEQYITHVVEQDAFKLKSAQSAKSALHDHGGQCIQTGAKHAGCHRCCSIPMSTLLRRALSAALSADIVKERCFCSFAIGKREDSLSNTVITCN